jgi:hypothetical protein
MNVKHTCNIIALLMTQLQFWRESFELLLNEVRFAM